MFGYMNGYQEEVFLKQIGLHDKKMLTIKVSIVANKTAVGGGGSLWSLTLEIFRTLWCDNMSIQCGFFNFP